MGMQINMINVESIVPNRFQPRKNFNQDELQELAESIKRHGMIQPMVLRKLGNKYEIIAGERRYKAALMNGMVSVPAIVMNLDDVTSAEVALMENVQRKDLTPIEEAQSYRQILQLGQMTQDEMAKKMGKNQSTISNKLRLLSLSEEVQQALLENKISERHARSLLTLKNHDLENKILNKILEKRLTVRETDNEIKLILENNNNPKEEEILDFEDASPIEEEIIDFEETEIVDEIKKDQLETNQTQEKVENQITPIEPISQEEQQVRKRAKFFNLEEEKNMNENNGTNLTVESQTPTMPIQQPAGDMNQYNPQSPYYSVPPQPQQEYSQSQYNPTYSSTPTPVMPQGYSNAEPQSTYPQQPQNPQAYYPAQPISPTPQIDVQPMYPQQTQYNQPYPPQYPIEQPSVQQPQPMEEPPAYQPSVQPQVMEQPPTYQPPVQTQPTEEIQIPTTNLPQYGDANMGVQEEVSPQAMITQQDITGAVSVIRNTIMNLQNNGYMLDAEEFDFENIHQITIKIQK